MTIFIIFNADMVPLFLFQHGHGATIFAPRKRVFVYELYAGVGLFESLLLYKRKIENVGFPDEKSLKMALGLGIFSN